MKSVRRKILENELKLPSTILYYTLLSVECAAYYRRSSFEINKYIGLINTVQVVFIYLLSSVAFRHDVEF